MVDSVILFDNVYDSIMQDMNISKEDIHFEIRRFLTDMLYENPNMIYGDPDCDQKIWINSMDWGDAHHQIEILQNMKKQEHDYIADLTKSKRDWFMFFSGATTLWQYAVSCTTISDDLRSEVEEKSGKATVEWNTKNMVQKWESIVKERCPLFVEFVDHLPFEVRGLVQIMGIAPYQKIYIHKDIMDSGKQKVDNILCSFMPDEMPKYINVYDEFNNKIKYQVKALWFDENELHSTDPLSYFCYSVKVDGVFDREKLKRYNIFV